MLFNIHWEPHQVMGNVVNTCQSRAVRVSKIAYIATTSWNLGVDEMIIFDKHSRYRARYHEMKKISIKMTRNDHRPLGYGPAHFSPDPARPLYCCESPDWVEKCLPIGIDWQMWPDLTNWYLVGCYNNINVDYDSTRFCITAVESCAKYCSDKLIGTWLTMVKMKGYQFVYCCIY